MTIENYTLLQSNLKFTCTKVQSTPRAPLVFRTFGDGRKRAPAGQGAFVGTKALVESGNHFPRDSCLAGQMYSGRDITID